MKKILIVFVFLVASQVMWGQSPFAFNFQSVARDLAGNPLTNEPVGFRLSLLQGSSSGTVVFIEEQTTSTNNFGLANIQVGLGTPVLGTLDALNWSNGPYFLQIELDINNGEGYQLMGVSPLTSVPYALHAKTTEQPGPQGLSTLIKTTTLDSGIECSEGGAKLEFGLDENEDGTLDEAEVDQTQTQIICNGIGSGNGSSLGGTHTSVPSLSCSDLGAVSYNMDAGSLQVCKPNSSGYSTNARFLITNELDCVLDLTGVVSNKDYWISFQVVDTILAMTLLFEPFTTSSFCGNVTGDVQVVYVNEVVDAFDPTIHGLGVEILTFSTGALNPFFLLPGRTYLIHSYWDSVIDQRITDVNNYTISSDFTDVVFY